MGLEAAYFVGALALFTAMIYGARNCAAHRIAEDITRERYRGKRHLG
jgi:hypothetical protein